MRSLIEWWAGLSTKAQYGIAICLILVSTILLLAGRLWIWGWAVGLVLFFFSGSSNRGDDA